MGRCLNPRRPDRVPSSPRSGPSSLATEDVFPVLVADPIIASAGPDDVVTYGNEGRGPEGIVRRINATPGATHLVDVRTGSAFAAAWEGRAAAMAIVATTERVKRSAHRTWCSRPCRPSSHRLGGHQMDRTPTRSDLLTAGEGEINTGRRCLPRTRSGTDLAGSIAPGHGGVRSLYCTGSRPGWGWRETPDPDRRRLHARRACPGGRTA